MKDKISETIIGPSVHVEGNFHGAGDIIVEGSVSGTLATSGSVRIGDKAKVKADVSAAHAFVSGTVQGNMKVEGQLELTASARVTGNVETQTLIVAAGALLHGKCVMKNVQNGNGAKNDATETQTTGTGKDKSA